jgi:ribosomal protein S27AE
MSSVVEPLCERCGFDATVASFTPLGEGRLRCGQCGNEFVDPFMTFFSGGPYGDGACAHSGCAVTDGLATVRVLDATGDPARNEVQVCGAHLPATLTGALAAVPHLAVQVQVFREAAVGDAAVHAAATPEPATLYAPQRPRGEAAPADAAL